MVHIDPMVVAVLLISLMLKRNPALAKIAARGHPTDVLGRFPGRVTPASAPSYRVDWSVPLADASRVLQLARKANACSVGLAGSKV
jgi:hypothetical protein